MKIEKVNDHQIRCTLTKADLADRELKISELAYGTEKAKSLFRDMMQQASLKFGFEAEDIPLMIEAIPLNSDCIVLIITKVEDPEELDTRFSKFAPSMEEEDDMDPDDFSENREENTDSIFDLFRQIQESRKAELSGAKSKDAAQTASPSREEQPAPAVHAQPAGSARIFSFSSMHNLIRLAHVTRSFYDGKNSIYKNSRTGSYSLVLSEENISVEDFNRICNVVSEYGRLERSGPGSEAYFREHYELVTPDTALQLLAEI
ncbi:MAG TPA: adaptor protein MecA [Candidatus Eisenbergiella pullicola]|nr:adaptor protein MecA [Candidatus Eisenbergiella pullicola]